VSFVIVCFSKQSKFKLELPTVSLPDKPHLLVDQFSHGGTPRPHIFVRLEEANVYFGSKETGQRNGSTH
jgi:hypothetical protein